MKQIEGTNAQQIAQLEQFADDDEVWQHAPTRTYYVGDAENKNDKYVLIGSVANYRKQLQDLIDAQ